MAVVVVIVVAVAVVEAAVGSVELQRQRDSLSAVKGFREAHCQCRKTVSYL